MSLYNSPILAHAQGRNYLIGNKRSKKNMLCVTVNTYIHSRVTLTGAFHVKIVYVFLYNGLYKRVMYQRNSFFNP